MDTAKIFLNGRSQAVRLPKAYRFEGSVVRIRRVGNAVILEPMAQSWEWLEGVIGDLDEDFEYALREPKTEQDRPELDFFK